jgi:RNA polymerase sigma-70 factor, ECF subfamily
MGSLALVSAGGVERKFREIVLPHLADALSLARWLTGSVHDGEDVVQEACIRALKGIDGFEGGNARAWLLAIVRNTCFTWLARHRPKALLLTDDPDIIEAASGTQPSPEAEMISKADAQAVERAIANLPHLSREIVVLRDINGLSYREIGEMLAIPQGTVMSRLARARSQLAAELGQKP